MFEQFGIINPWIYIAGAFMIVIAPGPNSLYVLKTSVLDGRRAGCADLLAVLIGDAVLIFLAYLGVAAMIKSHPLAFSMVKIGGGILPCVDWGKGDLEHLLRQASKARRNCCRAQCLRTDETDQGTALRAFRTALGLSLTNPSRFFFTFPFSFNSSTAHMLIRDFILYSRDDS